MNTGAERLKLMVRIADECARQMAELGILDDPEPFRPAEIVAWTREPAPELPDFVRDAAATITLVGMAAALKEIDSYSLKRPSRTFERAVRQYAGGRDALLARVRRTRIGWLIA